MTRKRIYVAGPFSCEGRCKPAGVDLDYMRAGMVAAKMLILFGFASFCPWLDYQYSLICDDAPNEVELKETSLAWLEVADAVYVVGDWHRSIGTLAEIKRAKELGIPVFYRLGELLEAM